MFSATFDLADLVDGRYGVRVTAFDTSGGYGSDQGTFQVDQTQPNGQLSFPANGAVVSGDLDISLAAHDPDVVAPASGIDEVWVSIEGFGHETAQAVPTPAANTWIGTVDTTQLGDGDAWLGARITDVAGNTRFLYGIKVTVDNDPGVVAPQVTITSPTDGATVADTVAVTGTVVDDQHDLPTDATARLFVDNVFHSSQLLYGDGAFSMPVDTALLSNGSHDLQVAVRDAAGNEGSTTVSVTVDNQQPETVTATFAGDLNGRNKVGTHAFTAAAGPATVTVAAPEAPGNGKKVDTWTVCLRGPSGLVVATATGVSGDTVELTTTVTTGTHVIEVEGKGAYTGQVTHLR